MARIFLAMNGKRINTLDDLRSNFNGKQMLDFYRAGRLQKWLEELGENDLLETVKDFESENYDDETLLSMLMAALELDEKTVSEQIDVQKQEREKQTTERALAEESAGKKAEIPEPPEEPEVEYTPLEKNLIEIKRDISSICKSVLKELWRPFENNLATEFEKSGIPRELVYQINDQVCDKYQINSIGWDYYDQSPETIMLSVMVHKYIEAFDSYGGIGQPPPELKHDIAKNLGLSYKKNYDELCSDADKTSGIMKRFIDSLTPAQSAIPVERKKFTKRKSIIALVDSVLQLSKDPDIQDFELTLETDLRDLGASKEKLLELDTRILEDILHAGLGFGIYSTSVFWYCDNRGGDFEYVPCFARIFRVCEC